MSKEVELNLGLEIGRQVLYSIQNLKMAQEQFNDYCRQYPKTRGADLFGMYSKRIRTEKYVINMREKKDISCD